MASSPDDVSDGGISVSTPDVVSRVADAASPGDSLLSASEEAPER